MSGTGGERIVRRVNWPPAIVGSIHGNCLGVTLPRIPALPIKSADSLRRLGTTDKQYSRIRPSQDAEHRRKSGKHTGVVPKHVIAISCTRWLPDRTKGQITDAVRITDTVRWFRFESVYSDSASRDSMSRSRYASGEPRKFRQLLACLR